jgi:hypothetical protein
VGQPSAPYVEEKTLSDISSLSEAVVSGAPPEALERRAVPASYRAAHPRSEDTRMFDGVADKGRAQVAGCSRMIFTGRQGRTNTGNTPRVRASSGVAR